MKEVVCRRGARRAPALVGVWLLALALVPAGAAVPPLGPPERAAAELALTYLAEGPEGWLDRLAAGSPLAKLTPAEARAEIELAAGPAQGAVWQLATRLEGEGPDVAFHLQHPSGVDDLLVLHLREEKGSFRLHSLSSWADTLERGAGAEAGGTTPVKSDRPTRPALHPAAQWAARLGLGLALASALGAAASFRRPRRALGLVAVGTLAATGAVAALLGLFGGGAGAEPEILAAGRPPAGDERATLVALKRALAQSADPVDLERQAAVLAPGGRGAALARRWRAQSLVQAGKGTVAGDLLAAEGANQTSLLEEVLRGRLALLSGRAVDGTLAWERALDLTAETDLLALEATQSLLLLGFEDRARKILDGIVARGSREAWAYYLLARWQAVDGDAERGLELLETAWELDPLEREILVGDPIYVHLLREGNALALASLGSPVEPALEVPGRGTAPLALPAGFEARLAGRRLVLAKGQAELSLPAAHALAPAATVLESAAVRRRRQEERALADLPALARAGRSSGGVAQPVLRERIELAAMALGRHQRWGEILDLTEGFATHPAQLPEGAVHLRAEALRRNGRTEEATRFLIELARHHVNHQRKNPDVLAQLSRLLLEVDEYDLAAKVMQRAESLSPEPPLYSEIPRIQMEKLLATSFHTVASRHFRLRFPEGTEVPYVGRLLEVLEAELIRLQGWIPYRPKRPIEVHLFPFRDFMRLYSGGGLAIGLFDGKVRMPFADVPSFHPEIVSIFSHEMAHALIAGATEDRAPSWFHEGLAQHVEPVQEVANPVPDYEGRGTRIAFPLLEPILVRRSDAGLVLAVYDQSAWSLHFIEKRWGRGGIHRLLAAFQRGLDTEGALREALGTTPAAFDEAFRAWCRTPEGAIWEAPVVRYD
ncbi:MAG TPA: hypothetical protein VF017_10535 [Thermoanaerobaculia bacterium]|nr:hypothetical protein [Thermoanaerobaculia bacterium]